MLILLVSGTLPESSTLLASLLGEHCLLQYTSRPCLPVTPHTLVLNTRHV